MLRGATPTSHRPSSTGALPGLNEMALGNERHPSAATWETHYLTDAACAAEVAARLAINMDRLD